MNLMAHLAHWRDRPSLAVIVKAARDDGPFVIRCPIDQTVSIVDAPRPIVASEFGFEWFDISYDCTFLNAAPIPTFQEATRWPRC